MRKALSNLFCGTYALISLCLAGTGCTRFVVYGPQARQQNGATRTATTSVYFDRWGDMYPEMASGLRVDNQRLLDQGASLQHYFQYRETTPALRTRQQQQADSLGQAYGVALGAPAPNLAARDEWVRLQDSMQTRFARRWAQQLRAAQTQRLVILVHGYNNDVGQTSWYGKLSNEFGTSFQSKKMFTFYKYTGMAARPAVWAFCPSGGGRRAPCIR